MKKVFLLFFGVFILSCVKINSPTSYTLEITPNMIDSYLKKEFPVEQELTVGKIILKDPVSSVQNDRLSVGTTVVVKIPFIPEIKGKAYVSGNVAFNQETKELFIVNPSVDKLIFQNTDLLKYVPESTKQIFTQNIAETISKIPVYKVEADTVYSKFLKNIGLKNGKILLTFGF